MSLNNSGNKQTIVLHNCEKKTTKHTISQSPRTNKQLDIFEQNDKQ